MVSMRSDHGCWTRKGNADLSRHKIEGVGSRGDVPGHGHGVYAFAEANPLQMTSFLSLVDTVDSREQACLP